MPKKQVISEGIKERIAGLLLENDLFETITSFVDFRKSQHTKQMLDITEDTGTREGETIDKLRLLRGQVKEIDQIKYYITKWRADAIRQLEIQKKQTKKEQ